MVHGDRPRTMLFDLDNSIQNSMRQLRISMPVPTIGGLLSPAAAHVERSLMLKANHTGFLPDALRKGSLLKWLKRVHAWLGLWGAVLGLLFGVTGILLNH